MVLGIVLALIAAFSFFGLLSSFGLVGVGAWLIVLAMLAGVHRWIMRRTDPSKIYDHERRSLSK